MSPLYDQIVEHGDALLVTFDEHGRIALFNTACETLTGLNRNDVVGQQFLDVFFPDGEHGDVEKLWRAALAGEDVATTQVARDVILRGRARYVRWQFSRLKIDGAPLLCAYGMDVTEARDVFERTKRDERLLSMSAMAAGLAHEIRNPLNAAHLQLTIVQRRLAKLRSEDTSIIEEAAGIVASELGRLARLVTEFLKFARPQPLVFAKTDLVCTVRDITKLLRPEVEGQAIALTTSLPKSVMTSVHEESIKQVLHNLVRNAIEACSPADVIEVALSHEGAFAVIRVSDNGKGLPNDGTRIFEPFFTTKATGTGLGLAIVHRIVSEHGGSIDVTRASGRTLFCIHLPLEH